VDVNAPRHLETERLLLSAPTDEDAPEIFERYAGDPDVTRYLRWPRHRALEDTIAFVTASIAEWQRGPAGAYLIRSRSDRRLLGGTGLYVDDAGRSNAVTGYVLAKDAWGKGYATEALRAVVDVARRLGVTRVSAVCHADHGPSHHVLEKCGFFRVGTRPVEFPNLMPPGVQDALVYRLQL
jgi:RimJ/RimL family protein N-acetyltransferase